MSDEMMTARYALAKDQITADALCEIRAMSKRLNLTESEALILKKLPSMKDTLTMWWDRKALARKYRAILLKTKGVRIED